MFYTYIQFSKVSNWIDQNSVFQLQTHSVLERTDESETSLSFNTGAQDSETVWLITVFFLILEDQPDKRLKKKKVCHS